MHTLLTTHRARLAGVHQRLEYENQQAARFEKRMAEIEAEKAELSKAVGLIDKAIEVISANGVGRIETTVTNGLRLVFDDPTLGLKILKKEGARGNSYEPVGQQGEVEGPFLDTFGGGIVNVAAFLLRIIMLKRFKLARFLVLDESFNNVSAQYLPMVSELLRSLARDGGYTIFAVTHQPILALAADRIYRVVPGEDGAPPTILQTTASELAAEAAVADYMDLENPRPRRERSNVSVALAAVEPVAEGVAA